MLKIVAFVTSVLCLIVTCSRVLAQDGYNYKTSFVVGSGELAAPRTITSHPTEDKYYVTAAISNQIYEYSSVTHELLRVFGKAGGGNQLGEFNYPYGVGVIGQRLYIADVNNHRIQVLDLATGNFVEAWGGAGIVTKSVPIFQPMSIKIIEDQFIVVAVSNVPAIAFLDTDGNIVKQISLDVPVVDFAIHKTAGIYVASNTDHVYWYDHSGNRMGSWTIPDRLFPSGIHVRDDTVFVSNNFRGYVSVFSTDGQLKYELSDPSDPNSNTVGLTTDSNGLLLVPQANKIKVYSPYWNPPVTSRNSTPAVEWANETVNITLTATQTEGGTGVDKIFYTLNAGPDNSVDGSRATFNVVDEGITSIRYWAIDKYGGVEQAKTADVKIDRTRPSTALLVDNQLTKVTLSANDSLSGIRATYYVIDNGEQQKYTQPIQLDGKQHSIRYWSVDNANNTEFMNYQLIGVDIKSFTLDRTSAVGGYFRTGRIILTGPTPAGGVNVLIWSDGSEVSVPVSVHIPANQITTTFEISTLPVSERVIVSLSATAGDKSRFAQLELLPPTARISATPRTVVGGAVVTLTVSLDGPAPAGGTLVSLATDNASVLPIPAAVTVAEGQTSTSVQVTSVPTQERSTVIVSASTASQSAMTTVLVDAPSPANVTLNPTSVNGGTVATGTITLNGPGPAGGYEVTLASSSAVATVPASIVIAAGQTTGTFDIATRGVQQNTTVTITATANNVRRVAVLSVRSAAVASVQVSPTTVLGSQSVVGRVNLTTPAPDGGLVVDLTSGNSNVIVPATVRIAAGETFATFDVQTKSVTAQVVATVTATFNGASRTTTLTVNALVLQNLSVSSSTIIGGNGLTATVTLSAPAPTGGVSVVMSSNNAAVAVPATINVAAGQTTATLDITTVAVANNTSVTLTATLLGVSKTASVLVTAPGLTRLMLNPSSVVGGNATTATVDIGSPAPAGGLVIALASNRSDVLVPATVTVPFGQSSVSVQVLTKSVITSTDVVVTATLNGEVVSNVVTLVPYRLASLAVTPSSVSGGSSFTGRVTLQQAAPAGGIVVSLASSDPAISLPVNVTIDAGKTTATFAGTTAAVTVTKNVTITASLNGNSVTDTLRVVQPGIKSISLSPSTITGGTGSQLTVTLDAPAPLGGWVVNLVSSDVSATLTSTATIAAGQTTVSVPVTTKSVLTRTAVTLTATDASGSQATTLVVEPVVGLQLRLSSTSIAGGTSVNLTVELAEAAPKTGATVALSADNASLVVPVSIKVLAGSKTATIAVKSLAVAADTTVRIAGTVNGFTDRAQLVVTAPRPQAVTFTPSAVLGGKPATGTLTLTGLAPVGGLTLQLSSDNAAATVPATVLVPAGKNVATFVVTTKAVTGRTPVNISASANGTTVSQQLAVQALTVQSVVLKPVTVVGGTPSIGTVTLNGVAPAGGLQVDLSSSVNGVTVPAKVFVPAGKNVVTFTATTEPVGSNVEATLTARANGDQAAATLLVTPVLVSSLTVAPTTVVGGTSATGTVKLAVAPGVDTVVTLSSANPTIAAVPATVVVKKGTLTATFTVTTKKPAAQTAVTLSAVTGGAAKTVSVTVKP